MKVIELGKSQYITRNNYLNMIKFINYFTNFNKFYSFIYGNNEQRFG